VHDIHLLDPPHRGEVHTNGFMMTGDKLEERFSYLSEPNDYNLFVILHSFMILP
jgi:hypothetical protein